MQFLMWNHHINGLDEMSGFHGRERHDAKDALLYLQRMLGDDFLVRSSEAYSCIARHPLLRMLANFAASSRRNITRFAEQLKVLEGSENFGNVLGRLHDATQFDHDALLIKAAARLVAEGLQARFEPTAEVKNNQKQADLRLENPRTGEIIFLEVAVLSTSQAERAVTDMNSAVFGAIFKRSYDLCVSGRWHGTPTELTLSRILEKLDRGSAMVLRERTVLTVEEEGIFEMAVCHQEDKARLLDPWCAEKGLSAGIAGPIMASKDIERIKGKIKKERWQLPHDCANVLLVQATDAFFRTGGVNRIACELEEELVDYEHVNLVIVHGEYVGSEEVPCIKRIGKHRFRRRAVEGGTEVDLVLLNQCSKREFSPALVASFSSCF